MNGLEFIAPENSFEEEIIKFFIHTANTVITRNRKYGDSYRNLRKLAKDKKKDSKLPIWIHQIEKLDRYCATESEKTTEQYGVVAESISDTCVDGAGYWGLEDICRRLDDVNSN